MVSPVPSVVAKLVSAGVAPATALEAVGLGNGHLLYEETGPLSLAVPIVLEMYSGTVRETRGSFAVLDESAGQLADPISRAAANAWVPRAEGEDVKDIAFASVREPGGLEFHRYRVLDREALRRGCVSGSSLPG